MSSPPAAVSRQAKLAPGLRLPLACAAAVLMVVLAVVPHRISESGYLNHVSGAYAALADDLAQGVLYRPLVSELGYGGTRYFPIQFVAHGLLVLFGLSLRAAGHLLSLLAGGLLLWAAARSLSRGAVGQARTAAPAVLAWAGAALALASRTPFMALAGIRGDILPVAIAVLGLALLPRRERSYRSLFLASLCLGTAIMTKPTVVWAPAGAFLALLAAREVRPALRLAALVTGVIVVEFLIAHWVSRGEMLTSFQACASGGGFKLKLFFGNLARLRPGELIWVLAGVGLTLARGRRALADPLCAAGVVCLPLTLFLLSGTGIHINHLIDVSTLGALSVAAALADKEARQVWARRALVAGTVLGLSEAVLLDGMLLQRGELEQAVAAIPPGPAPILSEQPWIPLLAGERPFLTDAYSLRLTRKFSPAVDRDFMESLARCRFRAVVLIGKLEGNDDWYNLAQFGPGFKERLQATYVSKGVIGAHVIYVPRCGQPDAPPSRPLPDGETLMERGHKPNPIKRLLMGG
jgi:hypothetical protein